MTLSGGGINSCHHRLSVLLLFSSSELGGAERSLTRMALASQEIDYQLATLSSEGSWSEWVRSQNHAPLIFGCKENAVFSSNLAPFFSLIRYVRSHPVDIIYVCGVRASFILRLIRVFMPRIKLVHGIRWNPNWNSGLDRFCRLMERFTHVLVDAWITNTAVAKQTLVSRCGIPADRIAVIYNGLETTPENVVPLNQRPMEVLTVANLNRRKGYLEYLSAVREVVDAVPEARFVFVGRDDMNGVVQRSIEQLGLSSHVYCAGFQADVSPWFGRARVFVLPSLWNEGCPTAILEAMSFAVPCVAFAIDGIPELIQDGRQGALLRYKDYSRMAAAIIQLLSDSNEAERRAKLGQLRVRSHFQVANTAMLHSKILQQAHKKTRK